MKEGGRKWCTDTAEDSEIEEVPEWVSEEALHHGLTSAEEEVAFRGAGIQKHRRTSGVHKLAEKLTG
ncbi:MAG: hypothetical protein PHV74_08365 [Dehalococcoidia bacterium]|nr:hypothetical protein [Dehalococcoidia bacterium]